MIKTVYGRAGNWLIMIGLVISTSSALLAVRDVQQSLSREARLETASPQAVSPYVETSYRESLPRAMDRESSFSNTRDPDHALLPQAILPTALPASTGQLDRPARDLTSTGESPRVPQIPLELHIPAIDLVAPVVLAETRFVEIDGETYQDWLVPDEYAAGWHTGSARLGEAGNIVLNGHHNIHGAVFASLIELQPGDEILLLSDDLVYPYQVANKLILPEKYQSLDLRMSNAAWLSPSEDARLTLVTCWPPDSNTHRLILVARPNGGIAPYPIPLLSPVSSFK